MATDPDTGEEVPLFDPLRHCWEEHFEIRADGTRAGRTPSGRATVNALLPGPPVHELGRPGPFTANHSRLPDHFETPLPDDILREPPG